MPPKRTKVTMSDIARESGLSLSTVSLALNDKPGLPLETRLKVVNAARELGYPVRSLSSSRTPSLRTIGMLVKRSLGDEAPPSTNIFFSHVISGIEAACRRENISLMYSSLLVDVHNNSLEIPRLIQDSNVDGLLMVGNFVDENLSSALQERNISTILVDAYCCSGQYDSVITDNAEGAYAATEYLIRKGHRHIAFVGSYPDTRLSFRYRREGYNQALSEYGIPERYYGDCAHNDRGAIIQTTRQLVSENPQITALLGCNDQAAMISMHGVLEAGKRIPDDISVVGFDNSSNAEISIPPLTTMHIDKVSMGRLAVQLLINRIENPDQACVTLYLHTSLVERQSVRNLRETRS
jgi:LacI family transcriptional regulator